jgi:hypothetical protein
MTAIVRSSTELVFSVPRIFKDDNAEDTAAVQPVLNQIAFYPLSQFDGKMKTIDRSKVPHFPRPQAARAKQSGSCPRSSTTSFPA